MVTGYRPVVRAREGLMLGIRQPMDGPVFDKHGRCVTLVHTCHDQPLRSVARDVRSAHRAVKGTRHAGFLILIHCARIFDCSLQKYVQYKFLSSKVLGHFTKYIFSCTSFIVSPSGSQTFGPDGLNERS
jgi:hypothetical protein